MRRGGHTVVSKRQQIHPLPWIVGKRLNKSQILRKRSTMNQHPTVDPTLVRDSLSQRSSIPATSAVTTTTTTPSAMSEKTNASMLRRLSPHPRAHNTSTTNAARLGLNPLKPIPHQAMGEVERPRIEPLLSTPPSTLQESLEKIKQTQLDHQRVLHSILWDLAMIKSEARCCSRKRARDQDADCDITTIGINQNEKKKVL